MDKEMLNHIYASNLSWYDKYILTQKMIKEAGIQSDIASGILAAVVFVLSGMNPVEAAQRTKTSTAQIEQAMQNQDVLRKAKEIKTHSEKPMPEQKDQIDTSMPSDEEMIELIKSNEGFSPTAYPDSNHYSIGMGFYLGNPNAKKILINEGILNKDINPTMNKIELQKKYDENFQKLINKKISINDKQAKLLLAYGLNDAKGIASRFTSNFNSLPRSVKKVIIDMAYNMGEKGLSGFTNLKNALEKKDYARAKSEIIDSKWYKQVGGDKKVVNRPARIKDLMDSAIAQMPTKQDMMVAKL